MQEFHRKEMERRWSYERRGGEMIGEVKESTWYWMTMRGQVSRKTTTVKIWERFSEKNLKKNFVFLSLLIKMFLKNNNLER
jgi:hypothetical protein